MAAAVLLAGCTVGPDFTRPDAKLPTAWCSAHCQQNSAIPSKPTAAPIPASWWTSFNDMELTKLEERVADANLDLKVASLRLAESRAERSITAADQYPTVNGSASAVRERASANGVMSIAGALTQPTNAATAANGTGSGVVTTPGNGKASSGPAPFNLFQAGFDASWELDLWGRVRREIEAADASVEAQADARRDLLISVMAEVARDYIQLRGYQTDYAITLDNLAAAKNAERVTRERQAHGLASELDVVEAASQVSAENALLPQLAQQQDESINRLSFLLGQAPGALRAELEQSRPVPPTPPVVPVGLPSDLARRRPDIREAEATLHQATAEIGVATADFYPSITLSGSAGLQSLQFNQLGSWASRQFSIGPSISLPIFEGGRLKATLNLRKAQQQEAAVNYQRVVLAAWHDIDNALTQYSSQQLRHDQLQATVQNDQKALRLAQTQYTAGTESFLQVLDAERRLLSAQQDLTDNTTQISATLVSLYKALGGGWEATYPEVVANGLDATPADNERHSLALNQAPRA
ncbi:efflux transporter outer membrane subunit [Dyella choica]|uniref:Efflux transporter outer membrane subunit n=2 Tax=Dyella choica TaxID=1927959 RepID=A0A3S0S3I7_9GAMM|nr:efflux transporter outer membrane subunit [Dyella choica]